MRMHSRHQQILLTEMEQPWAGPVVETSFGKEAGSVPVLPQVNIYVGKNPRSSEAKSMCHSELEVGLFWGGCLRQRQ